MIRIRFETDDKNLIVEWGNGTLHINPWNVLLIIFYLIVIGVIIHSCWPLL